MLLPIKPICSRPRKDGSSVIFIQYCYSASHRTLLNTQLVIPPECWNKRRLCIDQSLPIAFGDAHTMNEALRKMLRAAEDLVVVAKQKNVHHYGRFVKEHFKPGLDISMLGSPSANVNKLDVFYQIDEYIKSKSRKVTPGMVKVYQNMKALLWAFQEWTNQPITFDSFDFNFYEEFVSFLTFDYVQRRRKERIVGLKVNSIGKTIKQLRIFLRSIATWENGIFGCPTHAVLSGYFLFPIERLPILSID